MGRAQNKPPLSEKLLDRLAGSQIAPGSHWKFFVLLPTEDVEALRGDPYFQYAVRQWVQERFVNPVTPLTAKWPQMVAKL